MHGIAAAIFLYYFSVQAKDGISSDDSSEELPEVKFKKEVRHSVTIQPTYSHNFVCVHLYLQMAQYYHAVIPELL